MAESKDAFSSVKKPLPRFDLPLIVLFLSPFGLVRTLQCASLTRKRLYNLFNTDILLERFVCELVSHPLRRHISIPSSSRCRSVTTYTLNLSGAISSHGPVSENLSCGLLRLALAPERTWTAACLYHIGYAGRPPETVWFLNGELH